MNRFSKVLTIAAVAAVGAVILCSPPQVHADYQVRITEFNSGGAEVDSTTFLHLGGPGGFFSDSGSTPKFTVVLTSTIATSGNGVTNHTTTIGFSYSGGVGASSSKLLVEVLGDSYVIPGSTLPAFITSTGSTSATKVTTGNILANSVTMTSGVINGTVALDATPGVTLGGQLGMTTGTGIIEHNVSNTLNPNPAVGPNFDIATPFTFYQTYTFRDFASTGTGGMTGSSEVSAVPVPSNVILMASSLPFLGLIGSMFRRRQTASA